ncbi:MAG: proline--tRNA ligase [Candidatus Hadarchaeales archaeon]
MAERNAWEKNFSEWFAEMLERAEIVDPRYPVKGLYVWLPYGFKIRNNVVSILRWLLDESGHSEMLFPILIPEDLFRKEAEHIRGFEGQVYWVTHGGTEPLDVRLVLRPTSETAMYPMFSLWIKAHADLPLKIYQVVSVFRYETKMTKPLVRVREVTTFKEAHTAHASWEDAERQVFEAIGIYKRFFDLLGIPSVISKRPKWDTFAGAVYSIAFDTLAPDGKTLQIGTIHNLGQNFSKVYDVKYEKPDGSHEYVYQTCYGISERAIAAVLMVHGDDIGFCLPPLVAPIQIVIVPVIFKEKSEEIMQTARRIFEILRGAGFRVHLDDRDLRPGNKYYYWERRGVPLRVEIGPSEVEKSEAMLVRRDTGERCTVKADDLVREVNKILEEISENLRVRAMKFFESRIHRAESVQEAAQILAEKGGIVKLCWCGSEECGMSIEEKTGGRILGESLDEKATGKCVNCCGDSEKLIYLAKTY